MTNAERRDVVERIEESLGGDAGRCLWGFGEPAPRECRVLKFRPGRGQGRLQ